MFAFSIFMVLYFLNLFLIVEKTLKKVAILASSKCTVQWC